MSLRLPSRFGGLASVDMIAVILSLAALTAAGVIVVVVCRIHRWNRPRKTREQVYKDYLREQAILQQLYFDAYSAMLREAQRHTKG